MLATLFLTTAVLTACQEEKTENKETNPEVAVAESKVELPSQDTLIALIDQHFDGIMGGLSEAAYDFNIQDGNVTDAIYDAMKERFTNFATQSYIDGDLKTIAKEYCYSGCDFPFFPYNFNGALKIDVEEISDKEVKLTATQAANMMIPEAFNDIVYLKHEDGLWKINKVENANIDLRLTKEQAEQLLAQWEYAGAVFEKELTDGYHYKVNDQSVFISKKTGYIEEVLVEASPAKPAPTVSNGSLFDTYKAKYDATSAEVEHIANTFTGYTTVEMNEYANELFDVWDHLLNDMYKALKNNMSANEFTKLQQEQRQWIMDRDDYAEYIATQEAEGGSLYTSIYINALTDYTAQRCSEFLYDYMVGM